MAARKSKPMVNYAEQAAREAAEIADQIQLGTSDRIRIANNTEYRLPDGDAAPEFQGVVIAFISSNTWYDRPYDEDNPSPPACFALGPNPRALKPSENSPAKQNDSCAGCWANEFQSAPNNKGKACKNTRLLAIAPIHALDSPEEAPPIWTLAIPPTSLEPFDKYVNDLRLQLQRTPTFVVTEFFLGPGNWAAPRLKVVRPLEDSEIELFLSQREQALERLMAEPDVSQFVPYEPKPAARRTAGRRTAR